MLEESRAAPHGLSKEQESATLESLEEWNRAPSAQQLDLAIYKL